jgi:hypothetical protein
VDALFHCRHNFLAERKLSQPHIMIAIAKFVGIAEAVSGIVEVTACAVLFS